MAGQEEHIEILPLEEVMGERFGRYSKYIIQDRAIPDIRDGLKPVQRRILYAMYKEGNTHDKAFRKSAKTVGNVIGNYHPHGDTSVYDAMVRISQDWKMREPLVEMQGNNGSMDGDPAAAMRYTEARLSKIANEMTRDLDKETVEWVLNFDDTEYEPTVLPAQFPNLLVNGATGISAGYATDIPPHNLGEVIDATIHKIQHPDAGLKDLMKHLKGPDFPTGGIIQGRKGLEQAYKTGKGKIVVRAKTHVEDIRGGRQQIVATEIPYEVNKANLVRKIDDIILNKSVDGISEVRDETDREGLRIVIELKKDAHVDGILKYLFKNTDLQINYNLNMVAINDRRPDLCGIETMLTSYIQFKKEVVTRRTRYDLKKAEDRLHIVEGLIKAISILDEVIETIRASKNKADAKQNISEKFDFTEAQAEAIVSLQLYRLTNTDIGQLEEEHKELTALVKEYKAILSSEDKLNQVMVQELSQVKDQFANPRRTELEKTVEKLEIEKEWLIAEEDVMVTVSHEGYVKRTNLRSYGASNDEDIGLRDGDFLIFQEEVSSLDQVLLFTNKGNVINRPVHELADIKWKEVGQHISQMIPLEADETLIKVLVVKEFTDNLHILLASKEGFIKQTVLSEFEPKRTYKSKTSMAMKLKSPEDEVIYVDLLDPQKDYDVFLVSDAAYGLSYPVDEVSLVGARAGGVKSINLKEGESVVAASLIDISQKESPALLVTQRGAVKKMNLMDFEVGSRANRGLQVLRKLKTNPHEVQLFIPLDEPDQTVMILTDQGKWLEIDAGDFAYVDRNNNGSFVIEPEKDGLPLSFYKLSKPEDPA